MFLLRLLAGLLLSSLQDFPWKYGILNIFLLYSSHSWNLGEASEKSGIWIQTSCYAYCIFSEFYQTFYFSESETKKGFEVDTKAKIVVGYNNLKIKRINVSDLNLDIKVTHFKFNQVKLTYPGIRHPTMVIDQTCQNSN